MLAISPSYHTSGNTAARLSPGCHTYSQRRVPHDRSYTESLRFEEQLPVLWRVLEVIAHTQPQLMQVPIEHVFH